MSTTVQNGKGSAVRKSSDQKKYEDGWQRIWGKKKKKPLLRRTGVKT